MTIGTSPGNTSRNAPAVSAKERYEAAIERHKDRKLRPNTPAKKAWDVLRRRVFNYRAYVKTIDDAWNEADARGLSKKQVEDARIAIGHPKTMSEWLLEEAPEGLNDRTRELLEQEILQAPDGAEYSAFFIGTILLKQPIGTRWFGLVFTEPEEPIHDLALFEEKVAEDGQAATFLKNYRKSSEVQ
jgi:hypothetical protein